MGTGEFLDINFFTALFTLANTVALFLVLKKFLWGPVMKMIQDRQKEIDDMYADADRDKQQAAALRGEYEEKLATAIQTGEQLVREATERGQHRETEILQQANAQAEAMLQKAAEDIAREKKKALNDAKDEIVGLAVDIADKVVGRTISDGDREKLVDQFIAELGEEL